MLPGCKNILSLGKKFPSINQHVLKINQTAVLHPLNILFINISEHGCCTAGGIIMLNIHHAAFNKPNLTEHIIDKLTDIIRFYRHIFNDLPDQLLFLLLTNDIGCRIVISMFQHRKENRMKSAETHGHRPSVHQRNKTLPHFICGSFCKGHNQYARRMDTGMLNQPFHTMGDDHGLARTRSGKYHHRPLIMADCLKLRLI